MKNLYSRCKSVLNTDFSSFDFPEPKFEYIPALYHQWLFLSHENNEWTKVEEIGEEIGILDVETSCFRDDGINWVLMGTVLTDKGLYLWNQKAIITGKDADWTPQTILSVGTKLKIAIAHNSAFDRARVQESYTGQIFWIDTMSLHNAQNGFCKEQKIVLTKFVDKVFKPKWASQGSNSSLLDCYNYHVCHILSNHQPLKPESKKIRNLFVSANSFSELSSEYQNLAAYALRDVIYTGRLFDQVWKKWLKSTPHEYSKLGQLAHANCIARLAPNVKHYLNTCNSKYLEEITTVNNQLKTVADNLYHQFNTQIETDVSLAKQNIVPEFMLKDGSRYKKSIKPLHWLDRFGTPNFVLWLKTLPLNLQSLNWELVSSGETVLPKWYTQSLDCRSVNGHLLLGLKWDNTLLLFSQERGFYLENGEDLPRSKKSGNTIVRLFSKNFNEYFKNETLTSNNPLMNRVVKLVLRSSFWVGNQTRFSQCVNLVDLAQNNVLLPEIVAIGTATRRSSSRIWHVLPKASSAKLGSGFMNFIVPEEGHSLVHADLDSVEAVIAALYNIENGSTDNVFTKAVLFGQKEDDTDIHTVNAKLYGIPRLAAKEFLYSSLYGSGVRGLATTLNSNNKSISYEKAAEMATAFLTGLRGTKQGGIWVGGTASTCFNKLAELTKSDSAGFIGNKYPYPLLYKYVGDDFYTSRANAGIQAVGRMMLDYWLVGVLIQCPQVEFYYSVHDQLIFNCPNDQVGVLIQAIQQSHHDTYNALLSSLEIHCSIPNLNYVTSITQDVRLGKTLSSKGIEHLRSLSTNTSTLVVHS